MKGLFTFFLSILFTLSLLPANNSGSIESPKKAHTKNLDLSPKTLTGLPGNSNHKKFRNDIDFGKFPLYFICNKGQVNEKAKFYAKTSKYTLWITQEGFVFDSARKIQGKDNPHNASGNYLRSNTQYTNGKIKNNSPTQYHLDPLKQKSSSPFSPTPVDSTKFKREVSRLMFLKANKNPEIVALEETDFKVNYFKGNDKSKWQTHIPTSHAVLYKNLYKNIDLKVFGIEKQIEYDWIIKPGGNPGEIGFVYKNIDSLSIDKQGNLLIKIDGEEWRHKKPVAYQVINGKRIPVKVNFYRFKSSKYSFGFKIGNYNKGYDLIIDPMVLAFSSCIGGSDDDICTEITVDDSGAIYIAGVTLSTDFPLVNAYNESFNGSDDAFLAKISPDGTHLVFSTFFGGSGSEIDCFLEIDDNGFIYIGCNTTSVDLPVFNAFQPAHAGGYEDGFLAKFSNDGSSLLYSTYLGGTDIDSIYDIAVNSNGEIYATGYTSSNDFPILNSLQPNNLNGDAFIVKLSASGTNLIFSTFLGGNGGDISRSIAIDSSGNMYVAGETKSSDFPIYNAFQSTLNISFFPDIFVSKISADGSSFVYSTYLGGNSNENVHDCFVNEEGQLTIAGQTSSSDFPTTNGSFQSTKPNATTYSDGIVTRFDTYGNLIFSTFLGGEDGNTVCFNVMDGPNDSIYVSGITRSSSFPTLYEIFKEMYSTHCSFVTELQSDGSAINFSSTFPGISAPYGMAIDNSGAIYLIGDKGSIDGYHGFQLTSNGNREGYIAKLIPSSNPYMTITSPNGGEYLLANTTHLITWTGPATVTNVEINLSYYVNNSNNVKNITDSTPNTGSFIWTVPNISSDRCRIYVRDSDLYYISDDSDEYFTITPYPIDVTSPTGGEIWFSGDVETITWLSAESVQNVFINYSIDAGGTWIPIAGPIPNTNSYNWTIPDTPSEKCYLRVIDADSLFHSEVGFFSIYRKQILPSTERDALISLFNSTNGDNWTNSSNWRNPDSPQEFNEPGTEFTWFGITVQDNHVTDISLPYNNLQGSLPSEIGNLPYLERIDISTDFSIDVTISGAIPSSIENLGQLIYLDFSGNNFNGSIPDSICNLSNLKFLNLNDCELTGNIPTNIGNLNQLQSFVCKNNQLSGTIPGGLTNLSNLSDLDLSYNNLEGTIPTQIGNLLQLNSLSLQHNSLTGSIPSSIGNLINLEDPLRLNGNKLTGTIPTSMTSLTQPAEIDIKYNALFTDDAALITFLDTRDANWQTTQTTAPTQLSALTLSSDSLRLTWTPIIYSEDEGGYNIFFSTTEGGPYTSYGMTADKTTSDMLVTGLNPDTTYYFVIRTQTFPNQHNSNTVDSLNSTEISATTDPYSITLTSPNGGEVWDAGSSQMITWTSDGPMTDVMIDYSIDGGNSWKIITQSTTNDGNYNWYVPSTSTTQCLVRIRGNDGDNGLSDTSDGVFSIVSPETPTITLRSPNGGESWAAGSSQEIRWNTTGSIDYVTIQYSTDKGNAWNTIIENTANNKIYNWIIPNLASNNCLVQILANDRKTDPVPSDKSNSVFTIFIPSTPSLEIINPNGGEQLIAGNRYRITWSAFNTREEVNIQYSVNSGDTWTNIASSQENDGEYYWTVPDESSSNCLVRISVTDGDPSDVSDEEFSIIQPLPSDITVTSPNGGENWTAGSTQQITWTGNGEIDTVNIELSKDDGTTWESIIKNTNDDGNYNWPIPETLSSDQCRVRVSSNDTNSDPIPSDISDAVFTIEPNPSPTLKILTPNGGEQLVVGAWYDITWNAVNSRDQIKIEYSQDGGESWETITESAENRGDYQWNIPDTPSETCLIRISEMNSQLLDISNAVFSIVQPSSGEITITSPNGGETWVEGSSHQIEWETDTGIDTVGIELSTDNGKSWQQIAQSIVNEGNFSWTVPGTISSECLIRISANDTDLDPIPTDVSDQVFSITQDQSGEFRLTSPNGGEEWEVDSVHAITWTASGDISQVMIEYSSDNGSSWSTIVSTAQNSGSFDWTVSDSVSDQCLVRIIAADGDTDPIPEDVSDTVFSILHPSEPTVKVITPNGGEELIIGSSYEITWYGSNSRTDVKIEYSRNGGDTWIEIIDATENDGEYDWLVPDELTDTLLIRVSEPESQTMDVSDGVSSIVEPNTGDLTLLTPNGGENLESNTSYEITWTSVDLNEIIIEYSVNNGSTWVYIDKVQADSGAYTWTVPGTPSESCLVRVSGTDGDESPMDTSIETFTITDPSQITVEIITPNGGESLGVGEEYNITWDSNGLDSVKIEYSTDNGDQWITIDTVAASGGRYTWTVPDSPSDNCLIRISGNDSIDDPSDTSDSVFSIN